MADYASQIAHIEGQIAALSEKAERLRAEWREADSLFAIGERQRENAEAVLRKFRGGDYVAIGTAGPWWAREGSLLRRASRDELSALHALQKQGLIEQVRQ